MTQIKDDDLYTNVIPAHELTEEQTNDINLYIKRGKEPAKQEELPKACPKCGKEIDDLGSKILLFNEAVEIASCSECLHQFKYIEGLTEMELKYPQIMVGGMDGEDNKNSHPRLKNKRLFLTIDDFLNQTTEDIDFFVDDLIPKGWNSCYLLSI